MANEKTVRVFLPLPDELVILEVPELARAPRQYDAVQLPFPPPYDPSGQPIKLWTSEEKSS